MSITVWVDRFTEVSVKGTHAVETRPLVVMLKIELKK